MRQMPSLSELPPESIERVDACPFCASTQQKFLFTEKGFPYVQCSDCELIYLTKRLKEDQLGLIYGSDSYHGAGSTNYDKVIAQKRLDLLGPMPPGARIHEDGASNGIFVWTGLQHGYAATGNDIGAEAVPVKQRDFQVELIPGALDAAKINSGELDALIAFNLLCHLYSPWEYIKYVHTLLKPGGKFLLRTGRREFPYSRSNWGNWSAPEHVYHFTTPLVYRLLEESGFECQKMTPAFDSDYPYLFFDSAQSSTGIKKRVSQLLCTTTIRAWNFLKLPKEDFYLLATKR